MYHGLIFLPVFLSLVGGGADSQEKDSKSERNNSSNAKANQAFEMTEET